MAMNSMDFHVAMKRKSHPLTHTSFCVTWIAALLALCTAAQSSMRSCLRGEPQETKRLQGVIDFHHGHLDRQKTPQFF